MKFTSSVLTAWLVVVSLTSTAQAVSDSLRYAESQWALKKKAMIVDFLPFSEAEKSAFWPIYDSYSNATQHLEMESVSLLMKYEKQKESLGRTEMNWISDRMLSNDVLLAKLRKKYFKKLKRAVSPAMASEFMQFDNAFRNEIRMEVQKDPHDLTISALSFNNAM